MNIVLNSNCNKGCPYCFAEPTRQKYGKNLMDLNTFKSVLDKIEKEDNITVKLHGGEPTIHPQFNDFLDEVAKRKLPLTIISNFLFSDDVRNKIIETSNNIPMKFLINATNLDERNLINKWSENYNEIYKFLYQYNSEERMSVGYTFENNKDLKYYLEYTDFLLKYIPKIEKIRLSLSFPGSDENKEDFYFINNKEIGEKFLIMTKKALDIRAKPTTDCIIYPCMFQNKEEYKYVKKFNDKFRTKCEGAPTDIFPNGEAIHCYPLESKIKVDTKEYETFTKAKDKLIEIYQSYEKEKELPKECSNCSFYGDECDGPCLGFYK